VTRTRIIILLTSCPKIKRLLNFYHQLEQACSAFYVGRATSEIFGLHAGNFGKMRATLNPIHRMKNESRAIKIY
jgi:hypothetical protein